MTAEGITIEITIKGQAGVSLLAAVDSLDVAVVPRHTALVGISGIPELLATLVALEARGVDIARVSRPGG